MEYKKISVLIVTYKQSDVIGRNIESILQQKEYGLHEVVICDDCSPDNNWEVIQSYVKNNPKIIRAYRNDYNLGIYGNSNKLIQLRGDADLYCWLEGDDALCQDFFKNAQEYISNYDLEGAKCFLAGFKNITPDGNTFLFKNDYLKNGKSPYGSWMRGLVSWRGGLFTKEVLDRFYPAIIDKGLSLAESSFDGQWFLHTDTFISMPFWGSIYYSGIGVSVNLGLDSSYRKEEALTQWEYLKTTLKEIDDLLYAEYNIALARYTIKPTLLSIFSIVRLYRHSMRSYKKIRIKEQILLIKRLVAMCIK